MEKIEDLDLSPYFYSWPGLEGEEYNNFRFIEVDISRNCCTIYIDLELDPPKLCGGLYGLSEDTKLQNTYKAVVEFINYYNNLIERKTQ